MNRATGSESTPMRRIWTITKPPQMPMSRRPRPMSIMKWPKRPTSWMAMTGRRPMDSITGGKTRSKTVGAQHAAPLPMANRYALCCEAGQRLSNIAIAQALQRTVTELPHTLTRDAQHAADLFERVLAAAIQAEVQPQHLRVTALQRVQRLLDFIRQEAIHRLIFRVRQVLGDEALDQRAIAIGIERRVEPHVARVQGGERLHDLQRQLGRVRDLFGRRLAPKRLPQVLGRAYDARQVGRAVQRYPNRAALARERGEDRLADPPHGVRNELHALIRVELPRGRQQTDVAFTDQIGKRQPTVLILLGDRDHKAEVALHELLHRLLITSTDLTGERDLLLLRKQGSLRDLVQVLIQDVALVLVRAKTREQTPTPAATLGNATLGRDDRRLRGLRLGLRRRCSFHVLTGAWHCLALFGCSIDTQRSKKCSRK